MSIDLETLTLTELVRLQNRLADTITRRFERHCALAFSDIVGSTAYFARFGDAAGRRLQQLHADLLTRVIEKAGGRIVDTAGDGAFLCFPKAESATEALVEFQTAAAKDNASRSPDHHLVTRMGLHWGPVLTDGTLVSGDAVNLCSRVASTSNPCEIRITKAAFSELSNGARLRCRWLPPVSLKGIADTVDTLVLEWRDVSTVPVAIRVEETGEHIALPLKDAISFGRLRDMDGAAANDVVLSLPDVQRTLQLSRWHFELRRNADGLSLRPVSSQSTEVDGALVAKGEQVQVRAGSIVRLSKVMTLVFLAPAATGNETLSVEEGSV